MIIDLDQITSRYREFELDNWISRECACAWVCLLRA